MNVVAAQALRREAEIGLGAVMGASVAPAPTSSGWHPVSGTVLFAALFVPAFRAAYNAAKEVYMRGSTRYVFWKSWQYQGIWYATSRPNTQANVTFYQWTKGATSNLPNPSISKQGVSGMHARLAPYIDNDGLLDVESFGYDPGVGSVIGALASDYRLTSAVLTDAKLGKAIRGGLGSIATSNPSLHRWAALPVTPSPTSTNWVPLSATAQTRLQQTSGWQTTLANVQSKGQNIFTFQSRWYKQTPQGLMILGPGSAPANRFAMQAGTSGAPLAKSPAGTGQTNPSFVAPSATQVAATPPGSDLANAAVALFTEFSSSGVPAETTVDPTVQAFQTSWNADPISQVNGANGALGVDGEYGPNTQAALNSISSNSAPAINSGTAPTAPTSAPVPTIGPSTSSGTDWTTPLLIGAGVLAAGGVVTAVAIHMQKSHTVYKNRPSARTTRRAHA